MVAPAALLIALIAVPGPVDTQAPSAPPQAAPPSVDGYTYAAEGRRDPFLNPLGKGTEPEVSSKRGEGPAGMSTSEITVRGVIQSRGAMVAMIQGPDNKTYIVRQGDKLADGTIKTINQQGLIISQEVNDPLSIVKQRDIRKTLRSAEGGKE